MRSVSSSLVPKHLATAPPPRLDALLAQLAAGALAPPHVFVVALDGQQAGVKLGGEVDVAGQLANHRAVCGESRRGGCGCRVGMQGVSFLSSFLPSLLFLQMQGKRHQGLSRPAASAGGPEAARRRLQPEPSAACTSTADGYAEGSPGLTTACTSSGSPSSEVDRARVELAGTRMSAGQEF